MNEKLQNLRAISVAVWLLPQPIPVALFVLAIFSLNPSGHSNDSSLFPFWTAYNLLTLVLMAPGLLHQRVSWTMIPIALAHWAGWVYLFMLPSRQSEAFIGRAMGFLVVFFDSF